MGVQLLRVAVLASKTAPVLQWLQIARHEAGGGVDRDECGKCTGGFRVLWDRGKVGALVAHSTVGAVYS